MKMELTHWLELTLDDAKLLYGFCNLARISGDDRALAWMERFNKMIKEHGK